ncbi:MAG: glutathione synthase [Proteobacteria bacterium]|nr:glutathione synthase [Pseudomonadota bacterium]
MAIKRKIRLGVIMDPLSIILKEHDTTLAILEEAEKRQWEIYYMEQKDLFFKEGKTFGVMQQLKLSLNKNPWYKIQKQIIKPLNFCDAILMRKDPPFNMEYIYTTYLLELAEKESVLVVNNPQSLRDANEKMFSSWFPDICPPTLITRNISQHLEFLNAHHDIVVKPLDLMGGKSIFRLRTNDDNANVILETLTQKNTKTIMSQKFIPENKKGDKRVILIDGKPIPFGLVRIPAPGDFRGNLSSGASSKIQKLTKHDYGICEQVGPILKKKGLSFVGIDIIGNYLTEINVTSPTGIREIEAGCDINISGLLLEFIERTLSS